MPSLNQAHNLKRRNRSALPDDLTIEKNGLVMGQNGKGEVVDDKWLSALAAAVQTELDRVSQALTGRIKQLAERYAVPSAKISEEVETLSGKVDAHLKKMGFAWN